MQRELRREKRFRYRGVTVTANAVMIPLDHVLVSRSNGYGLRTNCSGQDSSKRRIATTQNFCPTIAVSAVTITASVLFRFTFLRLMLHSNYNEAILNDTFFYISGGKILRMETAPHTFVPLCNVSRTCAIRPIYPTNIKNMYQLFFIALRVCKVLLNRIETLAKCYLC